MDDLLNDSAVAAVAQLAPKPMPLGATVLDSLTQRAVGRVALPKGWELREIDNEQHLPQPSAIKATATLADESSFTDYVLRHTDEHSVVWCAFDPVKASLEFTAVFDEHDADSPGWRRHRATYRPALSVEWLEWTRHNGQAKSQVEFAGFIERNERDIHATDGMPDSLAMLKMATEFEVRQDQRLKSIARLQSGGVRLEYIADPDAGTVEAMRVFDKFGIAIPVFWGMPKDGQPVAAFPLTARLRYRQQQQAVSFMYELIRPDIVHQAASLALIERVRKAIGETPLLFGTCS